MFEPTTRRSWFPGRDVEQERAWLSASLSADGFKNFIHAVASSTGFDIQYI
jgi:hypothetical protein